MENTVISHVVFFVPTDCATETPAVVQTAVNTPTTEDAIVGNDAVATV